MMKMNKLTAITVMLLLFSLKVIAQTNTQSNSPYSAYGLGLTNNLSTGKTNALGNSGIAMPSATAINNLNPASMAGIPLKNFMYDFGFKAQSASLSEGAGSESKFNATFSNLAFAFPLSPKSGLGVTLMPYTNVGYTIDGIISDIEGSQDTFLTNIEGSGGLNTLDLNYGYSILPNFRVGVKGSYLFGKIEQTETNIFTNNQLTIHDYNRYNGLQLGGGLQYDFSEKFSLGSIVNLPTSLNGNKHSIVYQLYDDEIVTDEDLSDFKLPLELGFGFRGKIADNYTFYADYRKNFWDATNQSDKLGTYTDQDIYGLGVEFLPNGNPLSYWNAVQYRAGFNYDTGNLTINNEKVNNYALSVGMGLPLNKRNNSTLNLMYSYGQKGQVNNGLIKENYHLLTLNLSLNGLWFIKSKFN